MGIGKVTKAKGDLLCTYIVARYHPAGNVLGEVKQSVVRGKTYSKHFCQQFLAMSKYRAQQHDNLPDKSELLEQASTFGDTQQAGKVKSTQEVVAGGDNPAMDGASANKKGIHNFHYYYQYHDFPLNTSTIRFSHFDTSA